MNTKTLAVLLGLFVGATLGGIAVLLDAEPHDCTLHENEDVRELLLRATEPVPTTAEQLEDVVRRIVRDELATAEVLG